jgi:hypothetical protein
MTIHPDYALKKDIHNANVVRDTDTRQKGEYLRTALLVVAAVATLVFAVYQHTDMRLSGYRIEQWRQALRQEQDANRKLRLNLEALRAPKAIESRARALGFRQPSLEETSMIEVVGESPSAGALVARSR